MKNPFEKNDHKALIVGIVIGSVAVGAAAYLFLTETGSTVRQQLTGHLGRLRDTLIGKETVSAEDHRADYLQHKAKKPKTDREALLKHQILGGEQSHHNEQNDEQS